MFLVLLGLIRIVNNEHPKRRGLWAINWYSTILLCGGICVYPKYSLIKNIGFDNSGVHDKVGKTSVGQHSLSVVKPLRKYN